MRHAPWATVRGKLSTLSALPRWVPETSPGRLAIHVAMTVLGCMFDRAPMIRHMANRPSLSVEVRTRQPHDKWSAQA